MRSTSRAKRKAEDLADAAGEGMEPDEGMVPATLAVAFALLEVAFQIGRVADFLPTWGPPEEK